MSKKCQNNLKIGKNVKNFLRGHFRKNLPTAAALGLPKTNFLPAAPAQNCCPTFPLRHKIKKWPKMSSKSIENWPKMSFSSKSTGCIWKGVICSQKKNKILALWGAKCKKVSSWQKELTPILWNGRIAQSGVSSEISQGRFFGTKVLFDIW